METDLHKIKILSQEKDTDNFRFRLFLKQLDISDVELNALVLKVTKNICAQIDCRECNNCCIRCAPVLIDEEITMISGFLKIDHDEFVDRYIDREKSDNMEIVLKAPCPFFLEGKCSIESVKPKPCLDYPYLTRGDFRHKLFSVIENYAICPIVFNVFETLKQELKFYTDK